MSVLDRGHGTIPVTVIWKVGDDPIGCAGPPARYWKLTKSILGRIASTCRALIRPTSHV